MSATFDSTEPQTRGTGEFGVSELGGGSGSASITPGTADRATAVPAQLGLLLERLSRHYGGRSHALFELTLHVPQGGTVAILGPSGSGKSTALALAAGLDIPDDGRVLLDGRDITRVASERRGMAMVSQRPLLFPHLNVRDNVAFAPRMAGEPRRHARAIAQAYLEAVGLTGYGARRVATLSGGQAQRVALARALAAVPTVLLLDEPFSALDPGLRMEMHQLLADLREAHAPTVLLVTHDQNEAFTVADSVAVLMGGRLQQYATPSRLLNRPNSLAVSRFLGGRNEIPGTVVAGTHQSNVGILELPGTDQWLNGTGVLVIRQECIRLVGSDDSCDALGVVRAVRYAGTRLEVSVEVGGHLLWSEQPPFDPPTVGQAVGVVLPLGQRAVVPHQIKQL